MSFDQFSDDMIFAAIIILGIILPAVIGGLIAHRELQNERSGWLE